MLRPRAERQTVAQFLVRSSDPRGANLVSDEFLRNRAREKTISGGAAPDIVFVKDVRPYQPQALQPSTFQYQLAGLTSTVLSTVVYCAGMVSATSREGSTTTVRSTVPYCAGIV